MSNREWLFLFFQPFNSAQGREPVERPFWYSSQISNYSCSLLQNAALAPSSFLPFNIRCWTFDVRCSSFQCSMFISVN